MHRFAVLNNLVPGWSSFGTVWDFTLCPRMLQVSEILSTKICDVDAQICSGSPYKVAKEFRILGVSFLHDCSGNKLAKARDRLTSCKPGSGVSYWFSWYWGGWKGRLSRSSPSGHQRPVGSQVYIQDISVSSIRICNRLRVLNKEHQRPSFINFLTVYDRSLVEGQVRTSGFSSSGWGCLLSPFYWLFHLFPNISRITRGRVHSSCYHGWFY